MFTLITDSAGNGEDAGGGFKGRIERNRLLEGNHSSTIRARLETLPDVDLEDLLASLPVLWSPEHGPKTEPEFAYLGKFDTLRVNDKWVMYSFAPYPAFRPIPTTRLRELDDTFQMGDWGWSRTKITVWEEDAMLLLGPDLVPEFVADSPAEDDATLFNITAKRYDRLACVMMPFTMELEPVWEKIDREFTRKGIDCMRADTDLSTRRIIDKIASLIFHADVVICDFTGGNPNVFYEAGLAHAWTKPTIFIAEEGFDLPFDTRDQATIFYTPTEIGLKQLWFVIEDHVKAIAPHLIP